MNPNLNTHLGISHHHQGSHSSTHLQPTAPSLHSLHHTQLNTPHNYPHSHPSQAHLSPQFHLQQPPAPEHLATLRDSIDHHQVQQQTHIEHYKSSATPAFHGYIETTHDALIIFNACLLGVCPKVTRRLHERERRSIDSGAVYVFDEAEAGIKRWTDGRTWSPSRILNNFLVYREIDQKRQTAPSNAAGTGTVNASSTSASAKTNKPNGGSSNSSHPITNNLALEDHPPTSSSGPHHPSAPSTPVTPSRLNSQQHQSSVKAEGSLSHDASSSDAKPNIPAPDSQDQPQSQSLSTSDNQGIAVPVRRPVNRDRERALVGSLTSTYKFRPDGLVKKTISLAGMHMISYYRMEDVLLGRLRTPKTHEELRAFQISERFLQPAFYRVPPSWGITNGIFWVQDEGPDESSQVSNSNNASSFHNNSQRPGSLPKAQSSASNSVQGVRGSISQTHANAPDRLPSALSRPSSSASSSGSPNAKSPVSPDTFPLLAHPNLSAQAGDTQSPVISSVGGRPHFPRLPVHNSDSGASSSGPMGRPSVGTNPSTRYDPYPRPTRSPPLPASSTVTNNTLAEQRGAVPYYTQNQSSSSMNGYSTNTFLSDSHSTSLVAPDRNTRPDHIAHTGRTLNSIGPVAYGDSGSYRTHTTTSGGGESIYAQYTGSDTANNTSRSASVPPSPYGLPSLTRLRVDGSTAASSSPNTDTRVMGDFQLSASSAQQQAGRLSSPALSHGNSYSTYLSSVPTDFRCHPGGPSPPGRENNPYNSSQQHPGSLNNPSGQTSVSGAQSPTFLYTSPPTSTSAASFSSTYQFSTGMINRQPPGDNTSRRMSVVASLPAEMGRDNVDATDGGARISGLDRISGRAPQRNENENTASHWGQMNSSHAMKTEDGGGG